MISLFIKIFQIILNYDDRKLKIRQNLILTLLV